MSAENKAIGARLRAAREADPYWSRADLARRMRAAATPGELPRVAHVKSLTDMIKAWEAGKAVPSPRHPYRALYARVTGLSEAELFGAAAPSLWRTDGLNGAFTPDDEDRLDYVAKHPLRVDSAVLKSLAVVLAAQRRLEDAIGSAAILPAVHAQLEAVEQILTGAAGKHRPALVGITGQWTQFLGWLHISTGRYGRASALLDRALRHATESDDADLVSEVMGFQGQIAWERGQVGTVIGLRQAARRAPAIWPGQVAISASQEARAHAVLGDAAEADRLLDLADEHAEQARERADETPPWLYYQVDGFFELHRGQAWRHLGRHQPAYNRKAIGVLTEGLAKLPSVMRGAEWAGDFVYQLARAYRQAGEHSEAMRTAEELDALATRIGSQRLTRLAAELR
ncbi:hypothetical protein Acsp03_24530 [Actinomadura sp. NBRC 104412]|uniref:transcriptional regulator n=1 Tax=Actinomadura sp. NBRC 104412 TaxID=3032203 RepID=UPI0024A34966|nr:transcriptional regulator [Actinomadura sp. NBRC 104412]GLZ04987.1 hypothetical protein Acsp03_24530 [Actinomadura sp. NBRC 104412]